MTTEKGLAVEGGNSPASLISQAISANSDLDKLSGLLDLQLKWEANEARKAYVSAMAKFKKNPPEIDKDQTVDFTSSKGRTIYDHASLYNVTQKINSALSEHGLSVSWTTGQGESGISVTCKITHELGHSEETTLTAGPDTSGNKNSVQAIASTMTYLERYTVLALTGLATRENDDDGRSSEINYITGDQELELSAMIAENELGGEAYTKKLCAYMGCSGLDNIIANDFLKAKAAINAAIKRG